MSRTRPVLRPDATPQQVAARFGVSRESLDRLAVYVGLLEVWQRRMNLVATSSLAHVWTRHVADGLQLLPLLRRQETGLADLGSGAGIPGLILAIAMRDSHPGVPVRLIESNAKKCAFLREAVRRCEISAQVVDRRIESLTDSDFDPPNSVIVSRALAPVRRLIDLASPLIGSGTKLLFLKGQDVDVELTEATKYWKFRVRKLASVTHEAGTILELQEVCRVADPSG